MPQTLLIALPATPGDPLVIADAEPDGIRIGTRQRPAGSGQQVIALAPATRIAHFRIALAARQEKDVARAALYAVEDQLAQPIEEVHIAPGPRARSHTGRDIYAVDKGLLGAWIDQLEQQGFGTARIVPEQCFLEQEEDWLDLGNRALRRIGERIIAIEAGLPGEVLRAFPGLEPHAPGEETALFRQLARRAGRPGLVDMRCGVFAGRKSRPDSLPAWRPAAAIAIAALAVWTGSLIAERHSHNHAARSILQEAQQRYASLYPGRPVPADLADTTRRILASRMDLDQSGHLSGFLPMSAYLIERLDDLPGLRITALAYTENSLGIELIIPETLSAETVAARLQSGQASIRIDGVEPHAQGYTIRLSLEAVR